MGGPPVPLPEWLAAETRVARIEPRDEPIRGANLWLRCQAGHGSLGCRADRPSSDIARLPVCLASQAGHLRSSTLQPS
jgi:hypothetical protein